MKVKKIFGLITYKRIKFQFIVFGESRTPNVVYVSNNNFQATYDMMKLVSKENINSMWLLMGGESLVNMDRERGVRAFLNDKNYEMDLKSCIWSNYNRFGLFICYKTSI